MIYRISIFLMILAGLISCGERTSEKQAQDVSYGDTLTGQANISFETDEHDYGTLIEGEIVSYTFLFTNNGTGPLLITSASASCGCTVPAYSKEPTAPGDKGKIVVEFDTRGKLGSNHKTVSIRSNSNPPVKILNIYAEVIRTEN